MSFVFDEPNLTALPFKPAGGGEDTGFVENFSAAYESQLKTSRTDSRGIVLKEQWDPIIRQVKEKTGKQFINPANYLGASDTQGFGQKQYDRVSEEIFKYIRDRQDMFPDLVNESSETIFERAKKNAIKSLDVSADVAGRQTLGGWLGEFGGSAAAMLTDAPNIAITAADIYFTRGKNYGILKESLRQGVLNMGIEAITQVEVSDWYKTLGLPYDYKTFFTNVAVAGIGASAITAGFMGAKPALQFTRRQIADGIEALGKARARMEGRPYELDPDVKLLKEMDEIDNISSQGNVLKDDAGDLEHNARLTQSYTAVAEGAATKVVPNPPASAIDAIRDIHFHDNLNGQIFAYKPNQLMVDAELFQFKAGGDVMGVTERLQDVTKWDPVKANTAIVYEFADGRTFIADGHQRLALAKRLQESDPAQDIQLYAFKIREADGFSPAEARAMAAGKNLAEGTGTLIDAAKILRDAPELINTLPPRSVFVRQAQDLSRLTNKAFMAVVNDVVPPNFGSLVGRYITDEAQQLATLNLLRRLEPANMVQAEQIVRQAREAGFVQRVDDQGGLFGDEVLAESLFLERAKILDKAIKEMRKDRDLFATLVRNAEEIEEAGNTLAKLSNQEKEEIYGKAIAIIQANANVRGPISDALTRAAQEWKASGGSKTETVIRDFTESVRRAIEDGTYERIPNGGDRGDFAAAAQVNRSAEPGADELNLFDAGPGSQGATRQAEQLEDDLRSKLPAEAPREGMNPDQVQRQDLKSVLDRGATTQEIEAHPAVISAIERARTIPETHLSPGYLSENWMRDREFVFDGQSIKGYDEAVSRLYEQAKRLAWSDDRVPYREGNVLQDRQATIILGPPAAGKSTIADRIAQARGAAIIDGDEAKKTLPEYGDGVGAHAVHEEAQDIINMVLERAIDNGDNLVLPKVGKNLDSIERLISDLKEDGYRVGVINMTVPTDTAYVRMIGRFIETGRLVNPDYFRGIGDSPTRTYEALKQKGGLDGYATIDNSGARGAPIPVTDESGQLLEGVSLRLRRGGIEGPGQIHSAPETATGREFGEIEGDPVLMDLEIPVGERIDAATGERVAETMTVRQMMEEFKQDDTMLDRLVGCVK